MKVKVNPDGSFELDVQSGQEIQALDFVNAVQSKSQEKQVNERRSESMLQAAQKVEGSQLNALQYRTWEYLCENDSSEGIHISLVAKAFGMSRGTANGRLLTLEKMGYAKRVAKGYYRALTPAE